MIIFSLGIFVKSYELINIFLMFFSQLFPLIPRPAGRKKQGPPAGQSLFFIVFLFL